MAPLRIEFTSMTAHMSPNRFERWWISIARTRYGGPGAPMDAISDRMFGFKLAALETKILEFEAGGGKEAA